jgi:hypothetical protein
MSNDHSLAINFTSTPPHTNPIWEGVIQSGRNDFVPANTITEAMNFLDDPRRAIHFTTIDTTDDGVENPGYYGGLYGAGNNYTNYSHLKGPLLENDFEGMLLDYAEVEFLRAEAAVRGWSVSGTAETHYNNAIEADMMYWSNASVEEEITSAEITAYQSQADVDFTLATNMAEQMKLIAEQKWLAFYMQGQQAWIEYRRLDHPTMNVANNPGADTEDDIPVRFLYPVDEQNLNQANWAEAASNYNDDDTSVRLFWDVADVTSVTDPDL